MNTRKAQAALEFLMTYGWAILVVLIAIGSLAFFGVLSPDRFLPDKCLLKTGLTCADHKVTPGQIDVYLRNGIGDDIVVDTVAVQGCGSISPATAMTNGGEAQFNVPCAPALTGSKFSGVLNITYTSAGSGFTRNNIGDLTASIE